MNPVNRVVGGVALAVMVLAAGCSTNPSQMGSPRKETLHALTQDMKLLTVNTGQPARVLQTVALKGLPATETLVGIDYRVAKGVLFGLSRSGRVYTINTDNGAVTPVGTGPISTALDGTAFGFDFNPAADRIRVVSHTGQNLRLHPDMGTLVAVDTPLSYEPGDTQAGQKPQLLAAGYTYNKKDEKITTNFAIDGRTGTLVRQGSVEGTQPVVSPNTGRLFTVGALGTGALVDASLDIADVSGAAFAALRTSAEGPTRLYLVNLESGKAEALGNVANGAALAGIAVIP
ncbi:DUF4394 domain-containing protein [Rhodoferax sp. AJA081-3]|uniref:DUF4394 domain-containing protein n=1 Tax=Rhodoferax sp. AJA081-3 TaxID=2752316 RepID=UPI001ADFAEEF|nr:DUF4394 domain-containing protein [Rhodoferax sp. AJA081-3]QTN29237.1 DUF4394 domain-containing protein [Rhodoferax sp. AJA081-3]